MRPTRTETGGRQYSGYNGRHFFTMNREANMEGEETQTVGQFSVVAITNYPKGGKKAELTLPGGRRGDDNSFSIYSPTGKINGVELEFGDYYLELAKI